MVYPALLPLMRTPRLAVLDWTDAPADLNRLVRFAERRNLVSARAITFQLASTNWKARVASPWRSPNQYKTFVRAFADTRPPPSHYPSRSFKVVCCKQQNKRVLRWECILGYFSRRLLGFSERSILMFVYCEQCTRWFEQCTRWFKYDRVCLHLFTHKSVPVIFEPPCIFNFS
jgi:hypothetical protein